MRLDRVAVADLADRYFAEQCARLGPIDGFVAPARKRPAGRVVVARMDALAGAKAASRPVFPTRRLGGHDGAETDVEMVDRFRL